MTRYSPVAGERFERLVLVRREGTDGRNSLWRCRCGCGTERVVPIGNLRRGLTRSCGCLSAEMTAQRNLKHGYSVGSRYRTEYGIWAAMMRRCFNPNRPEFKDYGGRGITVCDAWQKFENFLGDMGQRPASLTLDRINNDGDYTPENCRWARRSEQARNTRANRIVTYRGRQIRLIKAIDASGLPYTTVMTRIHRGWPEDRWFIPKLRD